MTELTKFRKIVSSALRVLIIPPAHPGNFGDMVCIASLLELVNKNETFIIDLFSGTNPSLREWSEFEDINVIRFDQLSNWDHSSRKVKVILLGQDSMDSRYGDFHLIRAKQAIDLVKTSANSVDVAIWNFTLSPKYPVSETALSLFHGSTSQPVCLAATRARARDVHGRQRAPAQFGND